MWAQIIKLRIKPGKDAQLAVLIEQLNAAEQPDSGLLRRSTMRDQKDPCAIYTMVVFDSEEAARAREQDPRREPGMALARATMADLLDGPPEFVDLDVIEDRTA